MSLSRLEARTGPVVQHGRAQLDGFVHAFSHCGQDGTGKGNITPGSGIVMGVVYTLTQGQKALLAPFEAGYKNIEVELTLCDSAESQIVAYTYRAQSAPAAAPSPDYLQHYLTGMKDNDFPQTYIDAIVAQASGPFA